MIHFPPPDGMKKPSTAEYRPMITGNVFSSRQADEGVCWLIRRPVATGALAAVIIAAMPP